MTQKNVSLTQMVIVAAVGLLLVIKPGFAVRTVLIVLAAMLLLNGLIEVLTCLSEKAERDMVKLLGGIVMMLLGVLALLKLRWAEDFFPILCGIGFALGGLNALLSAWRMRRDRTGYFQIPLVFGVILIILAVVLWADPFGAAVSLTRIVGWFLVFTGACGIVMALSK
ncbi:MAG: DUF308 domain-containing protein [Lachnospiraceae bacterium]|nr:DUF308 domain-containing protein [Lachnospiraceae bacterium]